MTRPDPELTEAERKARAARVEIRIEAPDTADARWCLGEYIREIAARFEGGFDPNTGKAVSDEQMTPPAGLFVVARLDGVPVGCGGLRRDNETTGEIKRMWTAPAARGLGIARRVLQTLETAARKAGFTRVRLDTNGTLKEAQALYLTAGYREIERFNDNPYAHHWFEKRF